VSIGGLDFENSILNAEKRDIESTTTQVENEDIALTLIFLVQSIGDGCCSWLINNALNIETSDSSSILCGLSL